MASLVLLARLVLTVVFVVAGLAKLADRAGSRQALVNFGVPAALAAPGGTLLPLAELLAGVVVAQGPDAPQPSAIAWLDMLTGTQIALLVGSIVLLGLLAAQGWRLLKLMNQNGRLLVRIEALEAAQNSAPAG